MGPGSFDSPAKGQGGLSGKRPHRHSGEEPARFCNVAGTHAWRTVLTVEGTVESGNWIPAFAGMTGTRNPNAIALRWGYDPVIRAAAGIQWQQWVVFFPLLGMTEGESRSDAYPGVGHCGPIWSAGDGVAGGLSPAWQSRRASTPSTYMGRWLTGASQLFLQGGHHLGCVGQMGFRRAGRRTSSVGQANVGDHFDRD